MIYTFNFSVKTCFEKSFGLVQSIYDLYEEIYYEVFIWSSKAYNYYTDMLKYMQIDSYRMISLGNISKLLLESKRELKHLTAFLPLLQDIFSDFLFALLYIKPILRSTL